MLNKVNQHRKSYNNRYGSKDEQKQPNIQQSNYLRSHSIITIKFDRAGTGSIRGAYNGKIVSPWSGDPSYQIKLDDIWECEIYCEWEDGMLVRPLRKI